MTTEYSKETLPVEAAIPGVTEEQQRKAAALIQRQYRGHRTRRELKGHGLDPTTKWIETIRDAKYHQITTPRAPGDEPPNDGNGTTLSARAKWIQVTEIARRAGADDSSTASSGDATLSEASGSDSEERRRQSKEEVKRQQWKSIAKEKRKRTAKMMDLQYFLEMVDHKHRYGSNLRKYHARWKESDTNQNFFYWLDQGDGKDIELDECPRSRLEKEQVRYLSREERLNYLVRIDSEGKLRWAKNDEYVWTKDELYRDSVEGIIPTSDDTPPWKHNIKTEYHNDDDDDSSTGNSDSENEDDLLEEQKSGLEGERYVNEAFHRAKGPAKLKHVSAAVFFNHMIRQSLKKGHKWIFVADTSFRLYIGYKQSGAFQHSSFLHGSRILSAGLIKVKDGQLRRLSPLSGHYRPPAANFRAFVHTLEDEGCDMSHVSISRSYAILVGLESYVKTRRSIKRLKRPSNTKLTKSFDPRRQRPKKKLDTTIRKVRRKNESIWKSSV